MYFPSKYILSLIYPEEYSFIMYEYFQNKIFLLIEIISDFLHLYLWNPTNWMELTECEKRGWFMNWYGRDANFWAGSHHEPKWRFNDVQIGCVFPLCWIGTDFWRDDPRGQFEKWRVTSVVVQHRRPHLHHRECNKNEWW